MTSRSIRFALAAVALITASMVSEHASGGVATGVSCALVEVVLVMLAARGNRVAIRLLLVTSGLFAALMLVFGGSDPRILGSGVAFFAATYLLLGVRHPAAPIAA
jgi:hypothetical protein